MGSTGRSRLAGLLGLCSHSLHLLSVSRAHGFQAINLGELCLTDLPPMGGQFGRQTLLAQGLIRSSNGLPGGTNFPIHHILER